MESNEQSGVGGAKHSNNISNNNNSDNEHRQLVAEEEEEDEDEGQGNSNLSDDDDDDDDDDGGGGGGGGGGGESANSARASPRGTARAPFTTLAQIDADLALARTLQDQERAYMMLRMNNEGSDYGSWEVESYSNDDDNDNEDGDGDDDDDDDDFDNQPDDTHEGNGNAEHQYDESVADDNVDAFDVHAHAEFNAAEFSSDEAYARALQDAEEREMAARLLALAGIHDRQAEHVEDRGGDSQDTWEEVDPGELSYEELLALAEVVGTESRGLPADTISSLPSTKYELGNNQNGSNDSCVICREDYEDGETLTILSCKHTYHSDCINNWLKINKVCPVCSVEVSTSGHS